VGSTALDGITNSVRHWGGGVKAVRSLHRLGPGPSISLWRLYYSSISLRWNWLDLRLWMKLFHLHWNTQSIKIKIRWWMTRDEATVMPTKTDVTVVQIKPVQELFWAKDAVLNVWETRPTDTSDDASCLLPTSTRTILTTKVAQKVMSRIICLANNKARNERF
jgi:hypothetical protein